MKKGLRTFLIVILVLAALIIGVCIWQKNNIDALRKSAKMSTDEITEKMQEQESSVSDTAQKAGVTVRGLTDEEKEALYTGKISREDLIARISGDDSASGDTPSSDVAAPEEGTSAPSEPVSSETPEASGENTPQAPEENPSADSPAQDETAQARTRLAACMAEIYVMQAEYNDWLESANRSAIEDFNALPEEQQTATSKLSIGLSYASAALEKEKECDASMKALETEIRGLLEQLGEDTALVDEIHNAYLEEKSLKKAYYLGLH